MVPAARDGENAQRDRIDEWWNPSGPPGDSTRRALVGLSPKRIPQGGKAREKANRHPNGEVLLDNADAVIEALQNAVAFHDVIEAKGVSDESRKSCRHLCHWN
jgi:hypothetical protein